MEDNGERPTFPPPREHNACCQPYPHKRGLVQKSQISALFCGKWHLRVPTVGNVPCLLIHTHGGLSKPGKRCCNLELLGAGESEQSGFCHELFFPDDWTCAKSTV